MGHIHAAQPVQLEPDVYKTYRLCTFLVRVDGKQMTLEDTMNLRPVDFAAVHKAIVS
jgi:hypothetical protein